MAERKKREKTYSKIWVRGTARQMHDGGYRIGLYERHKQHPGATNEVFVCGPTPVLVARTPMVDGQISLRQIEQCDGPDDTSPIRTEEVTLDDDEEEEEEEEASEPARTRRR
jgi:hypothetical protein